MQELGAMELSSRTRKRLEYLTLRAFIDGGREAYGVQSDPELSLAEDIFGEVSRATGQPVRCGSIP